VARQQQQGGKQDRSRAETVIAAVEQAFGGAAQGTAPVRERAQELADELAGAASRFREVLEELRPPTVDELGRLRDRVAELERRVGELEAAQAKPAASRAKPAASRAKPAASRAKPAATRAKPAASKPKPKSPPKRRPPASGS
jgi:uncharacterized protein (DUF3084 family)